MASILSAGTTSATALNMSADTSGVLQLASNNGTVGLTMDTSQNVGIGTASPAYRLDVVKPSAGITARFTDGDGIADIYGFGMQITRSDGYIKSSGTLRLGGANGYSDLSIETNGNVTLQKNISVGGATPTTSGAGITFPATQSASSNANTLDDYEEGTWTPTLVGTTTYLKQLGRYTKIGNKVFIEGILEVNAINSPTYTGDIIGLPFTTNAAEPQGTISVGYWAVSANAYAYVSATLGQAGTGINLRGNVGAAFGLGAVTFFTNGTAIYFTGQYSV